MTKERQRAIAEKYAPIIRQEIGWKIEKGSPPPIDFITGHDFDRDPDVIPRDWMPDYKQGSIDLLLDQETLRQEGRIQYHDYGCKIEKESGRIVTLDLRGVVYYAVMATETHYYIWYLVFHAKDTASNHDNDLEGSLVIVDRKSEMVIALQPFGHNMTWQFPEKDFWTKTLKRPNWFIDKHRTSRIEGYASVKWIQDGFGQRYCPEVWIEMRGHGHRGAKIERGHLDMPIGYVSYYPTDSHSWLAPPFNDSSDLREVYDNKDPGKISLKYLLVPFGDNLHDNSLFARSGGNKRPITWRDENGGSGLGFFGRPVLTLLDNFGVKRWRDKHEVAEEYTFNPYRR